MASGQTNKGTYNKLGFTYRGQTQLTNMYVVLCSDTTTPTADTNTVSELSEIPNGNGYTTNGMSLTPGATDFDVWTENDASDESHVQLKDLVWTASGGNLPASGNGARWIILVDDNATPASREVYAWGDLVSNRIVSDTQTLTIQDWEIRDTSV